MPVALDDSAIFSRWISVKSFWPNQKDISLRSIEAAPMKTVQRRLKVLLMV
jgi:hypothetical protein